MRRFIVENVPDPAVVRVTHGVFWLLLFNIPDMYGCVVASRNEPLRRIVKLNGGRRRVVSVQARQLFARIQLEYIDDY